MRFSAEWQDDAQNAAPEERATVADLRLWLADENVTFHRNGQTSVDHVTISLYGLAEGLVHDWWRIFGARDRTFSLIGYRSGYVVPDLRLWFDGQIFQIEAHQRTYTSSHIRFWAGPTEIMDRSEAEDQLGKLIETVLERLDQRGVRQTSAALRWARVQASRGNADEAAFCEAAGAMGHDPYQIDDSSAQLIEDAADLFEGEPLTEFLAGAQQNNQRRLIDWIDHVESRPTDEARIADLRAIADEVSRDTGARPEEPAWSLGYRRARSMRSAIGLHLGHRFSTVGALAEQLGASSSFTLAPNVDGIRALRSDHGDGVHLHVRTHGSSARAQESHLFSFSRAVGDVACFPQETRAPINDLQAAYRQAAGRAFAAEFLAPIDEIRSMQESGRDVVSMSEQLSVSATLIERQIENAPRIDTVCK